MLAGILRVADGLDRPHVQRVKGVRVRTEDGAAHFEVESGDEPSVELWGSARKGGMFRAFFGLLPHFEWRRAKAVPKVCPEPVRVGVKTEI